MSVYPSWTRVEPDARATDPQAGARIPVADPFWFMARQWWIGEFAGFDGGTPVASRVEVETVRLADGSGQGRHAILSTALAAPLPDSASRQAGDWRSAHRLGRSALAALANVAERLEQQVEAGTADPAEVRRVEAGAARLPEDFPLEIPEVLKDRIPAAGRVDGVALLVAVRAGRALVADVMDILSVWAEANAGIVVGTGADTFAVETGRHDIAIVGTGGRVRSTTARGPALHWSDVTLDDAPTPATEVQKPVPVRLSFEGAPPIRWWGLEEAEVDYAAAPAGPSDLGQLLVAAAFQEQGGIYWRLPLDVAGNSLLRVHTVEIQDGFENRFGSESLERGALTGWKLGDAPRLRPDSTSEWMLILNEPDPLRGEPVEEAVLVADETDNLIWLIEEIVMGPLGRGTRLAHPPPRPEPAREEYVPRLAPPDTWIAYQQVASSRLERAVLVPLGSPVPPRTGFGREVLEMIPAMLGAGGHRLRRTWTLARSASGRRVIWQSRRSLAALPRGGSGLLHDQIVQPEL
jgi:hypothetical protein